jgi:peptidoglycan-N-acetylglucosamine deacetylase
MSKACVNSLTTSIGALILGKIVVEEKPSIRFTNRSTPQVNMKKVSIVLFVFLLASCACDKEERQAGLCLSFDDRSVAEWYTLRPLFNQSDVKVTFFISQPDSLSTEEVAMLKTLQLDGHEIGFHGRQHLLSEHYIKEHSYADYFKNEIDDGLKVMDSLGFQCQSFAYPYGAKYWFTDYLMLRRFKTLRGVSALNESGDLTAIDDIFSTPANAEVVAAISFDKVSGIDSHMLEAAMNRALARNEVLQLYGHSPANSEALGDYQFQPQLLAAIIQMAKARDLKFYTASELVRE